MKTGPDVSELACTTEARSRRAHQDSADPPTMMEVVKVRSWNRGRLDQHWISQDHHLLLKESK